MTTRRAECQCGQLSAICSAEPYRISVCHCLACKRKTGSAFGFGAWFGKNDVSIGGTPSEFVRIGDDGGHITKAFARTAAPPCSESSTNSPASSPRSAAEMELVHRLESRCLDN